MDLKGIDWKRALQIVAVIVLAVGAALFGADWLDNMRSPAIEVVEKEVVVERVVVITPEPLPVPEQELIVVVPEEPPHLFWGDWAGMLNVTVAANVYETLVGRSATGEIIPGLATSWEQESDTVWKFTLRQGVTFHNGAPFNAEVAAWNVNYTADPDNEMLAIWLLEGMSAEVLDDYALRIIMTKPEPILPRLLTFLAIVPPEWALTGPAFDGQEMIGTGPYKFEKWDKGMSITLVANGDYWGDVPDVKQVRFVWRPESAVRAAMLRVGEADIAAWLAPQDGGPVPTQSVNIAETPFLFFDPTPPLGDLRVRKAACYAIDKVALSKIFMGYASPANELVTSDVLGYNPDIEVFPQDFKMARELLAEAAVDGVPVDKEITLYGRKGIYPNATEVMEAILNWMLEAGFNVKLQMLEVGAWREINLDIPVPDDRVGATQSSHGNEVGDSIYTVRAYYGPYGPDTWYKYPGHGGGRRPITDQAIVDLIETAIPLTEAEGREDALQAVFAFHNENVMWACPMVHIQDLWGVSLDVDWTPRFDRRIVVKDVSWR